MTLAVTVYYSIVRRQKDPEIGIREYMAVKKVKENVKKKIIRIQPKAKNF